MSQRRQVEPRERRPAPPPKEANDFVVTAIGTACWAITLVVLLAWPSALPAGGRWWIWVCVVGLAMGLFAMWYVPFLKNRRAGLAAQHAAAAASRGDGPPHPPRPDPMRGEDIGPAVLAVAAELASAGEVPGPADPAEDETGYSSRDSGSNTVSSTDTPGSSTRS